MGNSMQIKEAIKHLSNPLVISTVFDQRTRDAIRTVVRYYKDEFKEEDGSEKKEKS